MIAIVNSGVGNLGSIVNMLSRVGYPALVTDSPDRVAAADKLILPGVGAFDRGVSRLRELKLFELIREKARSGTPLLGICLGMQLLTNKSEEGREQGLGLIAGETVRFRFDKDLCMKVPHMGWNRLLSVGHHRIFDGLRESPRFYFVHSYHVMCEDANDIAATCLYGKEFTCAVARGNVVGVQFHPEKSHRFGWTLLKNFAEM